MTKRRNVCVAADANYSFARGVTITFTSFTLLEKRRKSVGEFEMAEVQDRHRKAAEAWATRQAVKEMGGLGPEIARVLWDEQNSNSPNAYAQALADQEAEIAAALADMETPALVIEKGYNDGFQLGVLAAVTLVRSGRAK